MLYLAEAYICAVHGRRRGGQEAGVGRVHFELEFEYAKARNALRPKNSPYEFKVTENGQDFTVLFEAKDAHRSVVFSLAEHAILVRDDNGGQKFEVTLTFNGAGECKLHVKEEERELWQVRRMALEELMFQGY